jgi:hypothetical protein
MCVNNRYRLSRRYPHRARGRCQGPGLLRVLLRVLLPGRIPVLLPVRIPVPLPGLLPQL